MLYVKTKLEQLGIKSIYIEYYAGQMIKEKASKLTNTGFYIKIGNSEHFSSEYRNILNTYKQPWELIYFTTDLKNKNKRIELVTTHYATVDLLTRTFNGADFWHVDRDNNDKLKFAARMSRNRVEGVSHNTDLEHTLQTTLSCVGYTTDFTDYPENNEFIREANIRRQPPRRRS